MSKLIRPALILLVLVLLVVGSPVFAQDHSTPPQFRLKTGGATLVTSGPKREYFAAQFQFRAFTDNAVTASEDSRDSLRIRTTLTATQDGGGVAIGSPETFRSIVPEIEYRRSIRGALQAVALANVTFSAEGNDGAPRDARMVSAFAGLRGALPDGSWLFVGAGRSGPVGREVALGIRGGRAVGKGEAEFEYILPLRRDALRNKAWVLQLTTTYQVAQGEVR